jgi:tripartite-type tricarboxylate transporter receptor subunit TctC
MVRPGAGLPPGKLEDFVYRIARIACLSVSLLLALAPPPARAQTWPQRTVRIIVPLPPGAGTDIAARLFAERLSARWGQAVVVENRQGADGIPAVTGFVSAHDNHTLLLSFGGVITINPLVHDKLPYDPEHDLVPISSVTNNFLAIAATESLRVDTIAHLEQVIRAQPGKLNWAATPGLPLYAFDALLKGNNLEMAQVAYRDFTPALQDFRQGRIQVAVTSIVPLLAQAQTGSGRILAVLNRQRFPSAPEVPTIAEAGHPELTLDAIVGVFGWKDIPPELKERIAADIRAVGADPEIGARLLAGGSTVTTGTPAGFAATIEEQRVKVAKFAAAIGQDLKP